MGGKGSGRKDIATLKHEKAEDGKFISTKNDRYIHGEVEQGFKIIQRKTLVELRRRTMVGQLKEMGLEQLSQVLKVCRENLASIHARKMTSVGSNQIEFVTVAPMVKKDDAKD
jgi:hypothetical protein